MLLFFLVFFGIQIFILFCCAAAGNDAASQELSDQEQLQFIAEWKNSIRKRTSAEERPFSLQRGYSHSASLHAHEQNCFVILFI